MKTKIVLILLTGLIAISCQKKDQSGVLPHQTVEFSVGPDFEINMPGALPESIRMVALSGNFMTHGGQDDVAILLKHKGSENYDTLVVKSECRIDNLDTDYFKFINGQNVLKGKILTRHSSSWRAYLDGEVTFTGQLSIIYNPK